MESLDYHCLEQNQLCKAESRQNIIQTFTQNVFNFYLSEPTEKLLIPDNFY